MRRVILPILTLLLLLSAFTNVIVLKKTSTNQISLAIERLNTQLDYIEDESVASELNSLSLTKTGSQNIYHSTDKKLFMSYFNSLTIRELKTTLTKLPSIIHELKLNILQKNVLNDLVEAVDAILKLYEAYGITDNTPIGQLAYMDEFPFPNIFLNSLAFVNIDKCAIMTSFGLPNLFNFRDDKEFVGVGLWVTFDSLATTVAKGVIGIPNDQWAITGTHGGIIIGCLGGWHPSEHEFIGASTFIMAITGEGMPNPIFPNPTNNEFDVSIYSTLNWSHVYLRSFPFFSKVIYSVYLDPPGDIIFEGTDKLCNPGILRYNTTYRWEVSALDEEKGYYSNSKWIFTTERNQHPPNMPSAPFPENNSFDVPVDTDLNWTGGDSDADDQVEYDIFFDKNPEFTEPYETILLTSDTERINYDFGLLGLEHNTTYWWRIDAKNINGNGKIDYYVEGPLWNFTTVRIS